MVPPVLMTRTRASAHGDVTGSTHSNDLLLDNFLLRHCCSWMFRGGWTSFTSMRSSLCCDRARARDVMLSTLESAMMNLKSGGAAPLKALGETVAGFRCCSSSRLMARKAFTGESYYVINRRRDHRFAGIWMLSTGRDSFSLPAPLFSFSLKFRRTGSTLTSAKWAGFQNPMNLCTVHCCPSEEAQAHKHTLKYKCKYLLNTRKLLTTSRINSTLNLKNGNP